VEAIPPTFATAGIKVVTVEVNVNLGKTDL